MDVRWVLQETIGRALAATLTAFAGGDGGDDPQPGPEPAPGAGSQAPRAAAPIVGGPPLGGGRPFTVLDTSRVAPAVTDPGWVPPLLPSLEDIDPATRRRLADEWTADALAEHASIASFARFILQLLALGAPAELVTMAQRALADEVEHARTCFALASAYAGAPIGPGPLAIDAALGGPVDPAAIVMSAVLEGCVGETLAALQAGVAAEAAADPAVAAALTRIAADEVEHAAIAWRFFSWALSRGALELRDVLARVIVGAEAAVGAREAGDEPAGELEVDLRAHGRLGRREAAALRREGLQTIVLPALQALADAARAAPRACARA